MGLRSPCLSSSRDKLNSIYLKYHSADGHQTWKGGDLHKEAPYDEVIIYLDYHDAISQQTWQGCDIK